MLQKTLTNRDSRVGGNPVTSGFLDYRLRGNDGFIINQSFLKPILITFFAFAACVGCAPEVSSAGGEAGPPNADELAAALSEERLEKLSEVVRSLRDRDSNMMFPREDIFRAEASKTYPAQDLQNDVLLDGWGNSFVYTLYGDHRTYRLHSMGPNGANEHGTGDDAPSRGGETIIE